MRTLTRRERVNPIRENVSPNGAEKARGRQRSTFSANHPQARIAGHSQVQVGAVQEELSRDCLEPLGVG